MATLEQIRREYNSQAKGYNDIAHLPRSILKAQLLEAALADCAGLHILDFGGGSGLEARQAIALGAASVDIIDMSEEMLLVALDMEKKLGREGKIRVFQADASQPIDHLLYPPCPPSSAAANGFHRGPQGSPDGLRGTNSSEDPQCLRRRYDLVMSNFCFDHASTREHLEAMWRNATRLLRPGGRFVLTRVSNMRSEAGTSGKYGIVYRDFREFPGGVSYKFVANSEPPVEFELKSLELSYGGGTEMMTMCGLTDIKEVSPRETRTVREDPEFWDMFVRDPSIAVVTAVKAVRPFEAPEA